MANERKVTEGGRELLLFIQKRKLTIGAWCELHSLDRITVQRLINGDRFRQIPVDTAYAIQRATKGAVRTDMFRSATAVAA